MDITNRAFTSIEQVTGQYLNNKVKETKVNSDTSFEEILKQQFGIKEDNNSIKFSKHAEARLIQRNISLSDEQKERLFEGSNKAGEKGIKDSLVLMDGLAFIVNTKSNTVITAMEQSEEEDNIYTNIDGAVII